MLRTLGRANSLMIVNLTAKPVLIDLAEIGLDLGDLSGARWKPLAGPGPGSGAVRLTPHEVTILGVRG